MDLAVCFKRSCDAVALGSRPILTWRILRRREQFAVKAATDTMIWMSLSDGSRKMGIKTSAGMFAVAGVRNRSGVLLVLPATNDVA